ELRDALSGNRRVGVLAPAMRMQRVGLILARHGFGEILDRRKPSPAGIGPRLARLFADLGPTFIKLGQLLATREDLFPPEVTRALAGLHSGVPPMKPRVVERLLRRALGDDYQRAFASIDPTPLAAASIGQVHRAVLRTPSDGIVRVVVKVQRPGLRRTVAADLALMRLFAGLLAQAIPEIAAMDPVALLDAFERSITGELDFTREAANAARLSALLEGAPEVRVPRIVTSLVRPTVLVMEEVHGKKLSALAEPQQKAARAALLRAFTRQILDHGVFHADPHPGNVLVEDDGRLVLIDLGAVERVDERLRGNLGRLVRALALGRKRALADAVLALSPDGASVAVDRARLEGELAQLVADAGGQADGARVLSQMIALGRTHKLRMQPSLVALVRALALLDGVLRGLDPARDLVADLRREWLWSFGRRIRRWWRRTLGALRWSAVTRWRSRRL
ncbi:MAG TPA: AarF/UbiB family protein, partial [Ideonella sp.]|nr:AarF/UbiB family protein [Ideonella sp.]